MFVANNSGPATSRGHSCFSLNISYRPVYDHSISSGSFRRPWTFGSAATTAPERRTESWLVSFCASKYTLTHKTQRPTGETVKQLPEIDISVSQRKLPRMTSLACFAHSNYSVMRWVYGACSWTAFCSSCGAFCPVTLNKTDKHTQRRNSSSPVRIGLFSPSLYS